MTARHLWNLLPASCLPDIPCTWINIWEDDFLTQHHQINFIHVGFLNVGIRIRLIHSTFPPKLINSSKIWSVTTLANYQICAPARIRRWLGSRQILTMPEFLKGLDSLSPPLQSWCSPPLYLQISFYLRCVPNRTHILSFVPPCRFNVPVVLV